MAALCLGVRMATGALTCLLAIDYVWNAWHFAAQHHGIYRIYCRQGEQVPPAPALEKWPMRGFLLYVTLRIASATWADGAWEQWLRWGDWLVAAIPVWLLARDFRQERAGSHGRLVYLCSVVILYSTILWAVHERRLGLVLALATASALFHALEYLSLVGWSVRERHGALRSRMGLLSYLAPALGDRRGDVRAADRLCRVVHGSRIRRDLADLERHRRLLALRLRRADLVPSLGIVISLRTMEHRMLFPFAWPDVALVHAIAAIPLAWLLATLMLRHLGAAATVAIALLFLAIALMPFIETTRTSLTAAIGASPFLGIAIRAASAFGFAFSACLLWELLIGPRREPSEQSRRRRAAVIGVALAVLILPPAIYVRARCRHDSNKLGELLQQSRFGEAHAGALRCRFSIRAANGTESLCLAWQRKSSGPWPRLRRGLLAPFRRMPRPVSAWSAPVAWQCSGEPRRPSRSPSPFAGRPLLRKRSNCSGPFTKT